MTDEQLNKILDKIPTDKIYTDLLQPGLQTTGQILSDVFDLGNLVLLPFKLINERSKIFLRNNLERYEQKINKITDNERCKVDPQIGLPIVDKLTLLNQKELSELFINLLTKASGSTTLNLVHPAFLNVLNNLSQDEAILLFALRNETEFPMIDIVIKRIDYPYKKPSSIGERRAKSRDELREQLAFYEKSTDTTYEAAYNLTSLEKDIKLNFPDKIDLYLENLAQFGIIKFVRGLHLPEYEKKYKRMIDVDYATEYKRIKNSCLESNSDLVQADAFINKGLVEFTEFGKVFLQAVANDIDDLKGA